MKLKNHNEKTWLQILNAILNTINVQNRTVVYGLQLTGELHIKNSNYQKLNMTKWYFFNFLGQPDIADNLRIYPSIK